MKDAEPRNASAIEDADQVAFPIVDIEPIAFLSYSHEDNEKARGGIRELARLLSDEYSLLTGKDLGLFVDTDIKWGELWRERIDNALVATTFLIPIVTPRYFTRDECMRELFEFTERAKALGVDELVCPILYTPVDGLSIESDDAAKAVIAEANYEDWTVLRRRGVDSSEHVEAVHGLAVRLDEVAKRVADRQLAREFEQASGDAPHTELGETVAELRRVLGEWRALSEEDAVEYEKFLATDTALEKQRAKAQYGPSGARFRVAVRQVQEYLPMMERSGENGEKFLQMAAEIGPLLNRLYTIVEEHPEEEGVLDEVFADLGEAADAYIQHDDTKMVSVSKWAREHSHETRGMLKLADVAGSVARQRRELKAQVGGWVRGRQALMEQLSQCEVAADVDEGAADAGE